MLAAPPPNPLRVIETDDAAAWDAFV